MPKFIITWNCGYGDDSDVIECSTEDEASQAAYERWREDAENQASYGAEPYTKDRAEDLGLYEDEE